MVLVALCTPGLAAQQATFTPLGNLAGEPGCNLNGCYLSDDPLVSGDGRVVSGASFVPGSWGAVPAVPFRWTRAGGLEAIGPQFSPGRIVAEVDGNGSRIVGGTWEWTSTSGFTDLSGRLTRGGLITGASADEGVAVGVTSLSQQSVFRLDLDTSAPLELISTPSFGQTGLSIDLTVSRDGGTIGGALLLPDYGSTPVIWTAGSVVLPGDLQPSNRSGAVTDLSDDGSVAVGFSREAGFGWAGFRWTAATGMVSLARTGDEQTFSPARACNADGSVIVGQTRTFGAANGAAYIWTAGDGLRRLRDVLVRDYGLADELQGWVLDEATDVSQDGRVIVGVGINPAGQLEAWVVEFGVDCAADLTGDRALNINDFFTFLALFQSGDARADFTGEGDVDTNDFFSYLAAYQAGC